MAVEYELAINCTIITAKIDAVVSHSEDGDSIFSYNF